MSNSKAFADKNSNMSKMIESVLDWVENIVCKRRKYCLPAFSLCPTMLSKGFYLSVVKIRDCPVKGLPIPKQALVFTCLQYKYFKNTVGKGEIARNKQFILFTQCFLTIW